LLMSALSTVHRPCCTCRKTTTECAKGRSNQPCVWMVILFQLAALGTHTRTHTQTHARACVRTSNPPLCSVSVSIRTCRPPLRTYVHIEIQPVRPPLHPVHVVVGLPVICSVQRPEWGPRDRFQIVPALCRFGPMVRSENRILNCIAVHFEDVNLTPCWPALADVCGHQPEGRPHPFRSAGG
jgi:hypothetical protein